MDHDVKTVMSLSPVLDDSPPTPSPRTRRRQDVKSVREAGSIRTPTRVAPSRPDEMSTPTKSEKTTNYPATLNPFGDDEDDDQEKKNNISDARKGKEGYPDDLNPFGDEETGDDVSEKTNYDESLNPFGEDLDESLPSMSSLPSSCSSNAPTPRPRASVQSRQRLDMESREEDMRRSTRSTASGSVTVRPKSLRNSFRPPIPPPPIPLNANSPSTPEQTNPTMQHPFTNGRLVEKSSELIAEPSKSTPKKKSSAPLPPKPARINGNNSNESNNSKTGQNICTNDSSTNHALTTTEVTNEIEPKYYLDTLSCNSRDCSRRESDAGLGLDVSFNSESTNFANEGLNVSNAIDNNHDSLVLETSSMTTPSLTSTVDHSEDMDSFSNADGRPESSLDNSFIPEGDGHSTHSVSSGQVINTVLMRPPRKKRMAPAPPTAIRRTVVGSLEEIHEEISKIGDRLLEIQGQVSELEIELVNNLTTVSVTAKSVDDGHVESQERTHSPDEKEYRQQLVYQYLCLAKETCTLARKQEELMYQKREHKLEEQHADLEYEIRAIELTPHFKRTPDDEDKIQQLIGRLIEVIDQRNDVVENMTKINKR